MERVLAPARLGIRGEYNQVAVGNLALAIVAQRAHCLVRVRARVRVRVRVRGWGWGSG